MQPTPIDEMIEFVLEELVTGSDARRRALVRKLCMEWPSVPALSVCFAITSAASLVEDNLGRNGVDETLGPWVYKMTALLAADVYAVESMGHAPAKARDLLHFWRRVDPYFLEL